MKRWMSMVFLFCGLLGAQAAHAEIKTVLEWDPGRNDDLYFGGSEYRFDAKEGIARVMTKLCWDYFDIDFRASQRCNQEWSTVEGLSYDAPAAQIVYQGSGGKKSVCATVVEKRGIFGRKYSLIRPTRECRIFSKRENLRKRVVLFEAI